MLRLRRTAVAIAAAACMVSGFTAAITTPALAQSVHTPTHSARTSTTVMQTYKNSMQKNSRQSGPCTDGNGFTNSTSFWRCTGSDPTSRWVASSCAQGQYNAGTFYNVYGAINNCSTRVWLHEFTYPQYVNNGWSICIAPHFNPVFAAGEFPENIMVSGNNASCETILP